MGKAENAGYQHFLLFPHCFQKSCLSEFLPNKHQPSDLSDLKAFARKKLNASHKNESVQKGRKTLWEK